MVAGALTMVVLVGATVWASPSPSGHPVAAATAARPAPMTGTERTGAPGQLPPRLPGIQDATCANAPAGWLARERSLPGSINVPGAGRAPFDTNIGLRVYLERTYAVCGGPMAVHIAADHATHVTVEAIRVGAYGALTGRIVWTSPAIRVGPQPSLPRVARHTESNDWPTALTLTPDATWPPGLYVIRVRDIVGRFPDAQTSLYVQSHGDHAAYLAIGADLTQLAYNDEGNSSLYRGAGPVTAERVKARSYVASPHRALGGRGLNHLLTSEIPVAVLLDRAGVTVDWTSDMSLDADPSQVLDHATVILPGHSEYWTRRNYDTLTHAVDRGTNLLVLGANEIYWQARVQRDAAGTVTSMTVYRDARLDPVKDRALTTVQWRHPPLNRDPASLTGLGMAGVEVLGDGLVTSAPNWVFRGTGLRPGAALPALYGNEGDGPVDSAAPHNLQVLIRSDASASPHRHVTLATAYYSRPGGAGVFHVGTTEWACGALNRCHDAPRTPEVRAAMFRITENVLRAFSAPRAGLAHPSTRSG